MSFLNKIPDEGITFGTPRKTVTRYVVVVNHDDGGCEVYGLFGSVENASQWADQQAQHARWSAVCLIQPMLDINEE